MAAAKGNKYGKNQGRKKGIPNKATANAREAIAAFVEGNIGRLNGWLDQIAVDDPKGAFTCLMDVVDYHVPRIARTEITGADGGEIKIRLNVDKEERERIRRAIGNNV